MALQKNSNRLPSTLGKLWTSACHALSPPISGHRDAYRSSSAAMTLMLPSTATTSLIMCPSISLGENLVS